MHVSALTLFVCLATATAQAQAPAAAQAPPAATGAMQASTAATAPTPSPWQPGYRFDVGDTVEFKFPYTPELDFSAPVRPDGAISFPYLGDVELLGQTVKELSATLHTKYAPILKSPEVTIIVRSFQAMRVFVGGEVPAPGRVDFRPGLTVSQAVFSAGGFRYTANHKQVILLRPVTPSSLSVTLVSLSRKGATAGDWPLLPNDIVVVPKSTIANLNQIMQQYTRDLLPVSSLGFFLNFVGTTTSVVIPGGGGGQ